MSRTCILTLTTQNLDQVVKLTAVPHHVVKRPLGFIELLGTSVPTNHGKLVKINLIEGRGRRRRREWITK